MKVGRLVRALGSSMGARLAIGVLNYGLFWALAHWYEPRTLGGFSLLTNTFFAVQMLPLLGLSVPLIRRAATRPDDLARELRAAFVFAMPVALVLMAVVGVAGQHSHPELTLPFWLIAATLIPSGWTCVAESALIGRERFGDVARIALLESFVRSALALAAAHQGGGLVGVSAAFLAGRIVAAVAYGAHRALPFSRPRSLDAELQRRNWREVPVFLVITIASVLLTRLDVIVLSGLARLDDVGVYAAASRLYEAAQILPTVLALVVMPLLARQYEADVERFGAALGVAVRLALTLGLAVAVPASLFAGPVIGALYPARMAGAAPVLSWLVFGSVLTVTDVLLSSTMLAARAQRNDLQALLANLATLGLGLALLIPVFGPPGVAAAVVAGLLVRIGMRLVWSRRVLGLPPSGGVALRLAGATTLGLLAGHALLDRGPFPAAVVAFSVYGLTVLATGGFGRRPIVRLRHDLATLVQHPSAS